MNADLTVAFASSSSTNLLGYDHTQIEGDSFLATVHEEDRGQLTEDIAKCSESPADPITLRYRRRLKNGAEKAVVFYGVHLMRFAKPIGIMGWESEAVAGASGTGTASSDARHHLSKQAHDKMVGFVTNEMGNSFFKLEGITDGLMSDEALDSYREDFHELLAAGKNVQMLFRNTLVLSELARDGTITTQPEEVNVRDFVNGLVVEYAKVANDGVRVVDEVDGKVPDLVVLDKSNAALLITNGLSTAVKHVDEGEIVTSVERAGNKLRIDIMDRGAALGAVDGKALLSALKAGDALTGARARRTAVLLPVCFEVAAALRGSVDIVQDGYDVRYTILIPFTRAGAGAGAGGGGGSSRGGGASSGGGGDAGIRGRGKKSPVEGMYVLLVDDQKTIRKLGARFLDKLGCTHQELEDGDQVEAAMKKATRPFDCILMDIEMGRTDGAVVCQKLREAHGASLPIIAMTSHTAAHEVDRFMSMGFDTVLEKPFSLEAVKQSLIRGAELRGGALSRMNAVTRLDDDHRHAFTTPQRAIDEAGGDLPDQFDDVAAAEAPMERRLPGATHK